MRRELNLPKWAGSGSLKSFFVQYCVLVFLMVVFARLFAVIAIHLGVEATSIYSSFDSLMANAFPGIKQFAAVGDDPTQLRLFFYVAWGLSPLLWGWAFLQIQHRQMPQETVKSASSLIVLATVGFIWLLLWIVLFRDAAVHIDIISRGAALLWLLKSSIFGQVIFAFLLFLSFAIAMPALLRLVQIASNLNWRK